MFSDPWGSKNLNDDKKCQMKKNGKNCQKNAKTRDVKTHLI